jgi:hypothetical protein
MKAATVHNTIKSRNTHPVNDIRGTLRRQAKNADASAPLELAQI